MSKVGQWGTFTHPSLYNLNGWDVSVTINDSMKTYIIKYKI